MAGGARVTAKGTRGAPSMFPRKLYKILSEEDPNIIAWAESGLSFQLLDQDAFVEEIMSRFYRHQKLTSFQRQLNLYGFKKQTTGPLAGHYSHPSFQRDRPDLLEHVRRLYARAPKVSQLPPASSPVSPPQSMKRKARSRPELQQNRARCQTRQEPTPSPTYMSHSRSQQVARLSKSHISVVDNKCCRINADTEGPNHWIPESKGVSKAQREQGGHRVRENNLEVSAWNSNDALLEDITSNFPHLQQQASTVGLTSPSYSCNSPDSDSVESSLSTSDSCESFTSMWEDANPPLPLEWDMDPIPQTYVTHSHPPASMYFQSNVCDGQFSALAGLGRPSAPCVRGDTSGAEEFVLRGSGQGGWRGEEEPEEELGVEHWWNSVSEEPPLSEEVFGRGSDLLLSWGVVA